MKPYRIVVGTIIITALLAAGGCSDKVKSAVLDTAPGAVQNSEIFQQSESESSLTESAASETASGEENGQISSSEAFDEQESSEYEQPDEQESSEYEQPDEQESSEYEQPDEQESSEYEQPDEQEPSENDLPDRREVSSSEPSEDEVLPEPDEDALMVGEILNGTLEQRAVLLDVVPLYQYPELPTGCECVSLTMALNYLGESLSLTDIASDYLVCDGDIVTGFCGTPFDEYGAGIFPPGLVNSAKDYIYSNSRPLAAADTTGTELNDLFKLIDKGYPVLVWSTSSLRDPYNDDDEIYITYMGYEYWWYTNEHCVTLIGYDLDNGTVTVNDPEYGCSITYDMERFEYVYDQTRRMSAAVIKK